MTRWFDVRTFVALCAVAGCTPLPPAPTFRSGGDGAMEAGANDQPTADADDASTPPDGDAPSADVAPDGDAAAGDVAALDAPDAVVPPPDAPTDAIPPDAPAPDVARLTGGFVASGSTGPRLSGGFVWAGGSARLSGWLR